MAGLFVLVTACAGVGCASVQLDAPQVIWQKGAEVVQLEKVTSGGRYAHPVTLTPGEIATVLHGVRSGEQRNLIHRLMFGESKKIATFRDSDLQHLAQPLAKALAKAGPGERVYFHLSEPQPQGGEVTTTGWLAVQASQLILQLSAARDVHGPGSDITKYSQSLPDIPVAPTLFEIMFEPAEFVASRTSLGNWFAPDQLEELRIDYLRMLKEWPMYEVPLR